MYGNIKVSIAQDMRLQAAVPLPGQVAGFAKQQLPSAGVLCPPHLLHL
jgi:hypothetical protein